MIEELTRVFPVRPSVMKCAAFNQAKAGAYQVELCPVPLAADSDHKTKVLEVVRRPKLPWISLARW